MKANILTLAITLTVGIILAGSLLMPVISDATETERTFVNEGYFYVDKIASTDADTYTLEWASTTPTILDVNGTNLDLTKWGLNDGQSVSLFMSENNVLRVRYDGATIGIGIVEVHGATVSYEDATTSMAATITAGTASITLDGTSRSITYTDAFVISDDKSDLIMKKMDSVAYLSDDDEIYGIGHTNLKNGNSTTYTILKVAGTMANMTASVLYPSSGVTISNIVVNYEDVAKYDDLDAFKSVTFDATINSTVTPCTYSYVVVPAEITAERANQLNPGEIAILNALPILIITALVVLAAGALYLKRDD